jgi:hypothetical protein
MHVCGELNVYGLDHRTGKFHYYDDHHPGDDVRAVHNQELLMLLALQHGGWVNSVAPLSTPSLAEAEQEGQQEQEVEVEVAAAEGGARVGGEWSGSAAAEGQCERRECVNECSRHGRWANGSCGCEPIFAGVDCGVNLMLKAAAQLLAGLQLRYTGPMALNKQVFPKPINL